MTDVQWQAFQSFRERFRRRCSAWEDACSGWLPELQRQAAEEGGTPAYPVETPVVYNTALDAVCPQDEIRLILVSDNPGKEEQRERNRKYLVGQAGKLAARFFSSHPELGVDFRKNAVVLNKTPVHSARTKQLAFLCRNGGEAFRTLFAQSQQFMAEETAALRKALSCPLWIAGYGELRPRGLFAVYAETLARIRESGADPALAENVLLFQHFSMNRFTIDLRSSPYTKNAGNLPLAAQLEMLGKAHRADVLGW